MRLFRLLPILLTALACAVPVVAQSPASPFGTVPLMGGAPPQADYRTHVPAFSPNALRRPGDDQFQLHLEQPNLDRGQIAKAQRLPSFSTIPEYPVIYRMFG